MSQTISCSITEKLIKKHMTDSNIRQLTDTDRKLALRFNSTRTGGSWFIVNNVNNKTVWRKIANYPTLGAKAVIAILPEKQAQLAINPRSNDVQVSSLVSVSDLFGWHENRLLKDRSLSPERKASVKSAIKCHLMPRLGEYDILSINHELIDECFIWPLQAEYALSNVRSMFGMIKVAFKKAHTLKKIETDPMAGLKFTDFIDAPITPKDARLRRNQLKPLIALTSDDEVPYQSSALVFMMLLHGTRIGETRKSKWEDISFSEKTWFIPKEHTKTKQAHTLPLTAVAINFLSAYKLAQQAAGYHGDYLFSASSDTGLTRGTASKHIVNLSEGDWSARDLRKLARTCWMEIGVDYMVAELLLNHSMSKLDQAYIFTYAETQKREALERWHQLLVDSGFDDVNPETIPRRDNLGNSLKGLSHAA